MKRKACRRNIRLMIVGCLALAFLSSSVCVNSAQASPAVRHVYWPSPIQAAVNAASPGDKIIVHSGTYTEHVTIDSSKSRITLVGDDARLDGGCTLLAGFELIGVDYVTITNFHITQYSTAGIFIHEDSLDPAIGNEVRVNWIYDNCGHGIYICRSHNNKIGPNSIRENTNHGIFIEGGMGNYLKTCNDIFNNGKTGIELHSAISNRIEGPTVTYNHENGLFADDKSHYNTIKRTHFEFNWNNGIYVLSNGNTIEKNWVMNNTNYGIILAQGDNNIVWKNEVGGNGIDGIVVTLDWLTSDTSDWNSIRSNTIDENGRHGIFIYAADWNIVWNNTVTSNGGNGIQVTSHGTADFAEYNTIYDNFVWFNGWAYPPLGDFAGVDLYYDGWYSWHENHWGTQTVNDNDFEWWGYQLSAGTKTSSFLNP